MLTNIWTILWLCLCLIIFMSVLEAIARRLKMAQMAHDENEIRTQLRFVGADHFHIFTLQPVSRELEISRAVVLQPSPQQQQEILRQQEMDASNDPPPKYEDCIRNASVSIPITLPSDKCTDHQTKRY